MHKSATLEWVSSLRGRNGSSALHQPRERQAVYKKSAEVPTELIAAKSVATNGASLADLCKSDKQRVARLVKELTTLGKDPYMECIAH